MTRSRKKNTLAAFICFPGVTSLESTIPGIPDIGMVGIGLTSLMGATGG